MLTLAWVSNALSIFHWYQGKVMEGDEFSSHFLIKKSCQGGIELETITGIQPGYPDYNFQFITLPKANL